jgi:hypothetical protein
LILKCCKLIADSSLTTGLPVFGLLSASKPASRATCSWLFQQSDSHC